jgi:GAF domain-containing protein
MPNHVNTDSTQRIVQLFDDVSRGLVADDPTEEILGKIVVAGTALLPVAVCSLWRRDAAQALDILGLAAVSGRDADRSLPKTLKLPGSISCQVLETRRCRVVPDLAAGPVSAERTMASQRGLMSLLCAPVAGDGQDCAGVLLCFTDTRQAFSPLEILVAEVLARQAGIVWHMAGLRATTRRLKEELRTRKRVDRAKEILMGQRDMTAEKAYRWIQKRSMDTRRSMREVAETIILAAETGHYSSIPHALDLLSKPPRK